MKWPLFVVLIIAALVAMLAVKSYSWRKENVRRAPLVVQVEEVADEVVLDRKKQEHIWDLEHVTFQLETYFGKTFIKACAQREAGRLRDFFHDAFAGQVLASDDVETRRVGIVSEVRRRAAPSLFERVDASGLVERLVAALSGFEVVDRSRLRVLKIDAEFGVESSWQTHLLLTAHGVGHDGELLMWESEHDVTFRFEERKELDAGPVVAVWKWTSDILRRSDHSLMEEATSQAGLDQIKLRDNWQVPTEKRGVRNLQVAVEDFDRDGFLDIAVADAATKRPYLLRSIEGHHFEERAKSVGLRGWTAPTSLVSWFDYDNDGFPDLVLGDRLYHNLAGRRFEDVTEASGLEFDFEPTGCTIVDYDADGRLDLYLLYEVANIHLAPQPGEKPKPWIGDDRSGAFNRLWRNEGRGKFRDVTFEASATGGKRQTFAAAWLFYDEDHLPDVYIANDFGENVLMRNQGDGTFEHATETAGCGDFATSMGVASGDIDNDGQTEIYVANMYSKMGRRIIAHVDASDYPKGIYEQLLGSCAGNRLYTRRQGESQFRDTSAELGINGVGWAFAPAMADFDGDGWLDVYATTGFHSYERTKPDG